MNSSEVPSQKTPPVEVDNTRLLAHVAEDVDISVFSLLNNPDKVKVI
jgi:hypothetical protein